MKTLPTWLPPSFLVASGLVLLMQGTALQAVTLFLALALQVAYAVTEKKSMFLFGFLGFFVATIYLFWHQGSLWNVGWITTLLIAILLGYESTSVAHQASSDQENLQRELARDLDLWKNRFETFNEKVVADKQLFAKEVEQLEAKVLEKEQEANSFQLLVQLSHRETEKAEERIVELEGTPKADVALLEELRKQHEELLEERERSMKIIEERKVDQAEFQRILDELNELRGKYHEMELAVKQRQSINESLNTKPMIRPVISLKDLAKKL